MNKLVGRITDESYYAVYEEIKGNNIYSKKICPYCDEVAERGFERINTNGRSSGFAQALPHQCQNWVQEARHRVGVVERDLFENGFIIEAINENR